jgi:hypothetical protein
MSGWRWSCGRVGRIRPLCTGSSSPTTELWGIEILLRSSCSQMTTWWVTVVVVVHFALDRQRACRPCWGVQVVHGSHGWRSLMLCTGSAPGPSRWGRRYLAEGHYVGGTVRLQAPGEHEQVQEGDGGYAEHPRLSSRRSWGLYCMSTVLRIHGL